MLEAQQLSVCQICPNRAHDIFIGGLIAYFMRVQGISAVAVKLKMFSPQRFFLFIGAHEFCNSLESTKEEWNFGGKVDEYIAVDVWCLVRAKLNR